ncbi:MAG TPA: cytochrome c oxidase assembly protein [Rhodocyclaceae bacterium]|nr:cytochrome c oxidase assembly protein [Rhodocyclaceae bacterium]
MLDRTSSHGDAFFDSERELQAPPDHGRLVRRLLLAVVASAAFAFTLVPLYNVLCRVAGLNGRVTEEGFRAGGLGGGYSARAYRVDYGREVTVEFTGTVMPGLPWEMKPLTPSMTVHPGQVQVAKFLVRNLSHHRVEGQAIPGVTPGEAARYFHKVECFCFSQQTLEAFEEREMTVVFVIRSDLDPEVRELTLAYAFFPLPAARMASVSGLPAVRSESRS